MTRKDYQLFVKILREIPDTAKRLALVEEIVKVFKIDNPRFNETKFRQAGVSEYERIKK